MDYKLFEDFITLQALLKDLRIIQSGGAVKAFLAEYPVLLNDAPEDRRGKKLYLGDTIHLPEQEITITLVAPTQEELQERAQEEAEKKRLAELVKKMNQSQRKKEKKKPQNSKKAPVKFPGT